MSRAGNFSSSEIYKLVKSGRSKDAEFSATGLTYIQEKKYEGLLGRSLTTQTNSRPTSWGNIGELYVWEHKIRLNDYKFEHKERYSHPTIKNWTGMPDLTDDVSSRVGDIKCPFTLKAYCELVDCDTIEKLRDNKPEYYWQLVSNAILCEKDKAELLVFVPYKSDLDEIRMFIESGDVLFRNGLDQNKYSWLNWAGDEDLPYLIEGGHYINLHSFEFEVPQEDKDLLTNRVKLAVQYLNI
jgi:hypothetical protein